MPWRGAMPRRRHSQILAVAWPIKRIPSWRMPSP
uniref:Uncharacterized protein n=1 Tax=Arundo donax TaxID=35708 RepID=A0A0A8Y3W5_ARUDO